MILHKSQENGSARTRLLVAIKSRDRQNPNGRVLPSGGFGSVDPGTGNGDRHKFRPPGMSRGGAVKIFSYPPAQATPSATPTFSIVCKQESATRTKP